ncbi:acyl carrier protein [Rhodococcus sp. BH5]|uniref:acyl carrier protein n=1 Tax=Rhodococcus sp. BH5 TaxID=2871702 RepID=UPI0022CD2318|nr:acyl carrier protein [Rhodococcus sp. BH5]MCZ9634920.1 acyl carrier protein [Rhodococcus sp. BH5]
MSEVRKMIVELTGMHEFEHKISGDLVLSDSGIDSGDLVRLVLLIEERTDVEVTAEDIQNLRTLADYESFVANRADGRRPSGDI